MNSDSYFAKIQFLKPNMQMFIHHSMPIVPLLKHILRLFFISDDENYVLFILLMFYIEKTKIQSIFTLS